MRVFLALCVVIFATIGVGAAGAYIGKIVYAPEGQPTQARYTSQIIELGIDGTQVPCVTVTTPRKGVGLSCDWDRADTPGPNILGP